MIDEEKVDRPAFVTRPRIDHRHFALDEEPLGRVFGEDLLARQEVRVLLEKILKFLAFVFAAKSLKRFGNLSLTEHVDLTQDFDLSVYADVGGRF